MPLKRYKLKEQTIKSLAEVAWGGGEMSRLPLALKTCLASADPEDPLLFDEIDAGVSGAMATLLKRLASSCEVFCVIHQPMVDAAEAHHLKVAKVAEERSDHA